MSLYSRNRVELIGRVGQDPEIRSLKNGRVANFSVATSESWLDKETGERKEETEWHRVTTFNEGLIKVIENQVQKGTLVGVSGKIKSGTYKDKDGVEKRSFDIQLPPFAGELLILADARDSRSGRDDRSSRSNSRDDRGDRGGRDDRGDRNERSSTTRQAPASRAAPSRNTPVQSDMDDDIPF